MANKRTNETLARDPKENTEKQNYQSAKAEASKLAKKKTPVSHSTNNNPYELTI